MEINRSYLKQYILEMLLNNYMDHALILPPTNIERE